MQAYLAGVKFLLQRLCCFRFRRNSGLPCPTSLSPQNPQLLSQPHACIGSCYHAHGYQTVSSTAIQISTDFLKAAFSPDTPAQENASPATFHGANPLLFRPLCLSLFHIRSVA
jgi:hypothetical protein